MPITAEILAALTLVGAPGTTIAPDAGLTAAQPRVDSRAAAPAEMGLARLRRVELTVTGDPGDRVLLGLSTERIDPAAALLPGFVLGLDGLTWVTNGLSDPSSTIGADGVFRTELLVPDALPLGTRLVAQALTFDPLAGSHEVSPALDLWVEEVIEYRFHGSDAGWRAVTGSAQAGPEGLAVSGRALMIRPLQGLEPGVRYSVEMSVEVGAAAGAATGLSAGVTASAQAAAGAANAPLEPATAESLASGPLPEATADRRGRLWVLLETDAGPVVLDRALVRLRR